MVLSLDKKSTDPLNRESKLKWGVVIPNGILLLSAVTLELWPGDVSGGMAISFWGPLLLIASIVLDMGLVWIPFRSQKTIFILGMIPPCMAYLVGIDIAWDLDLLYVLFGL